ncbi:hypothetical protein RIF29_18150 [Crotalaria pallida]|uniref:Phosphoribosyltransferase domain-containing protein n=1 Tax=Crotalaria pallida TaxID=3830 RepID=A0AAN9IKN5_CROPI
MFPLPQAVKLPSREPPPSPTAMTSSSSSYMHLKVYVHMVCESFLPRIKIVTYEIEIGLNEDFRAIPGMGEFGDHYFGTDDDDDQHVVIPS